MLSLRLLKTELTVLRQLLTAEIILAYTSKFLHPTYLDLDKFSLLT